MCVYACMQVCLCVGYLGMCVRLHGKAKEPRQYPSLDTAHLVFVCFETGPANGLELA